MRSEIEIVEACLHGVAAGLPVAPLAPDVSWEGPPASEIVTGDDVSRLLRRFGPQVEGIRAERHIVEGPFVASLLELRTSVGTIPAFVCFRLSNGLVQQIRTFYDPRGVLGSGTEKKESP